MSTNEYIRGSAHAQICPVCIGRGEISRGEITITTDTSTKKVCYGCNGIGWVTVRE